MSDYSVRAVLSAVDNGFTESFQKAARSVENLKNVTGNFSPGAVAAMKAPTDAAFAYESNISRVAGTVGKALTGIGKKATVGMSIPLGLGFKKAIKASSEFETSMTGVRKTTDMTDAEFAKMSNSVRQMSKVLPASTKEIAGVAEAAGQLGIKKEHLLGFSKTMIDLGYTTNLSSEEAALALSRFANVTQMSQNDFDKLGSTIVDLGNNFATSEVEIVNMGSRLAGTGAQVGLSEAQIMGLSTAMSSVGIQAEAGGSAFSRVMQKMNTAVTSGSKKVEGFARISGMSAQEFSNAWKTNPQEAITAFVGGLGRAKDQGLDTVSMLKELGINGIREVDTLLRLAGAGDLLSDAFTTANTAWEENTALAHEADMFYGTFESRMAMVKNRLEDVSKAIGDRLKPIVADLAEGFANLAEKFLDLSPGMQDFIIKIGLAAAAFGPLMLVFGALGKAISGAITSFGAFKTGLSMVGQGATLASTSAGGFAGVLGGLAGKIAGAAGAMAPWLLALAAVAIALKLAWEHSETFRDTVSNVFSEVSAAAGEFGGIVKEAFGQLKEAFAPVLDALKELGRVIGESLGPVFSTVAQIIGAVVVGAFKLLGSAVKLVVSAFTAFAPVIEGVISVASGLAQIVGAVLGPAITIAGGIIKGVIGIFIALGQAILDVGTAIMDKLAPVFDFVGQVLGKVGEVCSGVGEKIGGFMEKIGLGAEQTTTSFQAMDESTSMSFDNMLNKSNESTTGILGAFDLLKTGSIEKSSEMNMQLAQLFEQMGGQLPAKTQDMAYKIVQAMTEMGVGSIQEANALVQGVGVKWEEMSSWTDREWNQVADIVRTKMAETQANASKESSRISNDINTDWSSINTDTNKTWTDIQSTISQEMGTSNTNAVNEASQINTGISSEFDSMKTTVQTSMDGISSSVQTGMSKVSNQIKTDLSGVANAFKTQLSAISSQVKSSMDQMGQGIKTSMTTATTTVSQSLKQIQQGVTQAMTAIKTAVKQGMTQVVKEVQNGCQKAVQEVNNKKSSMQSAGRNLTAGLASGIRSGRSAVVSAAISVAQAAIQAAKSKLAIHSPSRVFKEIGAYTMEGMEIGILKNGRDPVRAVEDTAKKIANVPFATQLDGMYQSLNKDITKSFKLSMPEKQPMSLILHLGRHAYKTFVEDITDLQDQEARLEEAYSF